MTDPALQPPDPSSFISLIREHCAEMCRDIRAQQEAALADDCRPHPPFVPCPTHIGNDPCDDQDPWMDEDY